MNGNAILWLAMVVLALWHLAKLVSANPRTYRPF
jgi:hypothetical protein